MAVSPVVTHTSERTQHVMSPLKIVGASAQTSTNGTPKPTASTGETIANLPATLDLAEQMNDDEKRKYVKGTCSGASLYADLKSDSRRQEVG